MKIETIGDATLYLGDCLDVLKDLPDNSIDAVVCDPPYGLTFMGKHWDYDVPSVEIWAECLRVLKPGGHLLAFAGTRTQHRMAVRIEDAGFEIRDMIAWVYSTGFPKSHNLDRLRGTAICGCDASTEEIPRKQASERELHSVRDADVSSPVDTGEGRREVLQPRLSEQGAPIAGWQKLSAADDGADEPGMERRCDIPQTARELRFGEVCTLSGGVHLNGSQGRLCDGASSSNGSYGEASVAPDRVRASHRPQPAEQLSGKSGTVALQPQSQDGRVWPLCERCGKQRVPSGLGTALKPSLEPITVARKPLIGTVAENVLAHGTGALNIDGCRVASDDLEALQKNWDRVQSSEQGIASTGLKAIDLRDRAPAGRWPANLIHDGSEEVLAGFPRAKGATSNSAPATNVGFTRGARGIEKKPGYADDGSAARFFYVAKASRADRDEGLDDLPLRGKNEVYGTGLNTATKLDPSLHTVEGVANRPQRRNHHPTVKPTELMRYLCRLVTPPGGVVLDPFMGSGSTGKAAVLEGFRFIGMEREAEFFDIATARVRHASTQPTLFSSPEPAKQEALL